MQDNTLMKLLRQIHEDENGAISLETVLIIGAIALPILIFLLKWGWPWIKQLFIQGTTDIENNRDAATQGTNYAAMLATLLLLAFALVAAVTDLLWSKIYNWNTYGGIVTALALCAACSTLPDAAARSRLEPAIGWLTLWESASGLLTCGGLMVVCFLFFAGIGGGDVKLMAMLGAWLGWENGITALLWTFVLAACFAMIGLVWKIGPLKSGGLVVRMLAGRLRLPWFAPLTDEERAALKPPIFVGPSALAAVLIVKFGTPFGLA